MTVGEALTEARYQAGLSVDELSERTRIRETVIRSIERDDYGACGGDLYVRGYVRAIAGAVGIDAQPLIREYDLERAGDPAVPDLDATQFDLPVVSDDPDATRFDLRAVSADPTATRFDLPPVAADPPSSFDLLPVDPDSPATAVAGDFTATRFDLPPVSENLMAAGYELPTAAGAAGAVPPVKNERGHAAGSGARARARRRGRPLLVGVAVLLALAVVGIVGVKLASGGTTSRSVADTSTPTASTLAGTAAVGANATAKPTAPATPAATAAPAKVAPVAKPSPTAKPSPVTTPVTMLPIAAAAAFGPDGLADGDNQGAAHYAIAGNAPLPWSTQWYDTPQFGLLKHGTGLLLDLGHKVTITSVRIDLTQYQGVNLQLRVGDGTAPQDLSVAATADNTGGTVRITLPHPASARYLLIWFTQLPPNGSGEYQESVYHVLVNGRG